MSIFKKAKQIKLPDTGPWAISGEELKSLLDNYGVKGMEDIKVKGMEDIKVKDYDIYHSYTEAKKMAKATNKADLIRQFYTELDNMGVTVVKDNEQVISDIILAILLEDAKVVYEEEDGENLLNEAESNLADTNGDPIINTPYRAWDPKTKRYYSVRHLSYDRETGKVTEVWTSDIEGGYQIENAELDEQTGYYDDYLKLPLFVNDIVRINFSDHGIGYVLVGRIIKGIGGRYDIVLEHSAPIHQTSIWDLVYQFHGSLAKKLGTYRDQEKAHE